jgi:hypothetical protein
MQALQAEVTMSGAKIISTSKSEGGGSFTIIASRLGRETSMQELPVVADWITMKDKVVKTGREDIVEEYTTSGDGIRQDFVINNKPEGQGKLLLDIAIEGTGVTTKSHKDGIEVRLSSGRKLLYHALKVTDATDKELESSFVKTDNNRIIIAVEDKNALYPVRIDPTITDADWSALGSGTNGIVVFALAFDDSGNLYAGGEFDTAGGIAANNIAKWNGSSWGSLGSGMNNTVRALGVDKSGNIYAGGEFDTAGGVAANRIAKWDGNAWSALGSGTNSGVWALAIDSSGSLYAGGDFTSAGGVAANCIAKWDGNVWDSLGSGTNKTIFALAIDSSGNLYAGGQFTTAGGKASAYVAMCRLPGTAVIPRRGDNVSRPFLTYDAHAGLMRFQLKAQTQITYRIYSLLGRQVFQASETIGAGEHSMRINTLLNTRPAARGTYIVNFKAGDESIRFRLVVDK